VGWQFGLLTDGADDADDHNPDHSVTSLRYRGGNLAGGRLPFLDTYRTLCVAPSPEFLAVLNEARQLTPVQVPQQTHRSAWQHWGLGSALCHCITLLQYVLQYVEKRKH